MSDAAVERAREAARNTYGLKVEDLRELDESDDGYTMWECGRRLIAAVRAAVEADRAEEQRKETEDVPF